MMRRHEYSSDSDQGIEDAYNVWSAVTAFAVLFDSASAEYREGAFSTNDLKEARDMLDAILSRPARRAA